MKNLKHVDSKGFLSAMTEGQKRRWARGIVNRLMKAWGVDEHKALAQIYGIHDNTPSNWIHKKAVPWTVIYACHKETGRSLDWLYDGEEPTVDITPELNAEFNGAGIVLLKTSANMGLIAQLKNDGFESVVTGMMASFIEITNKRINR
jgi:hypothetical protein